MSGTPAPTTGTAGEVLATFLKLGLTAFGGPIAHIGYFRDELVTRRRWLSDAAYAEQVALCQFLPGPASSQLAFLLGAGRAGRCGGVAATLAFTAPSAMLMLGLAFVVDRLEGPLALAAIHGLKLVAVVIVAQALVAMAGRLTPDLARQAIAIGSAVIIVALGGPAAQIGAIGFGAVAGIVLLTDAAAAAPGPLPAFVSRRAGAGFLGLFAAILIGAPLLAARLGSDKLALFAIFYRAGALVFGGGHVVLPLLHNALVPAGWVGNDRFVAGYGAAQALPGPLFAIAAYLGAIAGNGVGGALIALAGIFLPGLLLAAGVQPFWAGLRMNAPVRAAIAGTNAAVVGILAHALYDPLWTSAVLGAGDAVLAGVVLLAALKWPLPPVAIVGLLVAVQVGRVGVF